ncbi:AAA family ATPase [Gemmiger sp. An120]|uniref:AAA family ATPase n=1 Tax=Gemmiger sp. An120 TaxID=1965549 RepID=UPI001FA8E932|nr:AAA family ATPase [Gemmiger sp. An120]
MQGESLIYQQAANLVIEYPNSHAVKFDTSKDEIISLLNEFKEKFSPEVLKSLSDDDLLSYIFLTADGNNDSLCYHLEFNPKLKRTFGSISGGSSFKFGLFQRQEDGKWTTGAPKSPQILSTEDALQLGKTIRDNLVNACEMIQSKTLDSVEDYEKLDDDLNALMGKFASYAWVQKYFHMIFPDKFIGWYVADWLKHILFGFGINPSEKYYGMNGQLALIKKRTSYMSPDFQDICYAMFGEIRHFYRLGSSDESKHYAEKWREEGIVAIGWREIGDLLNFIKNGTLDRDKVAEALLLHYYQNDKKTASRKAGELKAFYETSASSVMTVMDGAQLIAFVDGLSPYFYNATEDMAHQKSGIWHSPFDESDRLPEDEGYLTSCYEIKKPENLLFLYKKYYEFQNSGKSVNIDNMFIPIIFQTGYQSSFERNRIIFGAPGTGKSFKLNCEKDALLADGGEYERVTFHPDYSYANFVGTYKPVPCKDSDGKDAITYSYVPGPFMRTYVKAIKNGRTDAPKPFLLVIEEINRANVAAVFGDVFQLLDRGDDEVSEYPIQASEDIKRYLAGELGGNPDDYSEIRIPDNMFIWATMNSADQGVFPMDTAFKRRWDFTYLGIDDSEAGIVGKKVILGEGEYRRIVEWNVLRKAINNELLTYKVNEDKLMGPYFISKKNLPESEMIDPTVFTRIFKNKVIMYLFDDAAKQKRITLFGGCDEKAKNQYSKICREFDAKGVYIFCEGISSQFIDNVPEDDGE